MGRGVGDAGLKQLSLDHTAVERGLCLGISRGCAIMDPSIPPTLDPDTVAMLRSMSGGDASMLRDLLALFQTESDPLITELTQAVDHNEVEMVRKLAHALKGSAANLGALELNQVCARLEGMARAGTLEPDAPQLASQLAAAYERAKEALRREIEKG